MTTTPRTWTVLLLAVLCCACCDEPIRHAKVVSVYVEVPPRDYDDWRTVVDLRESGNRVILRGRWGEIGDEFQMSLGALQGSQP